MVALNNFPMVSQLTTVTGDGRPSENAQFDCVAASIDAACRWLLGKPEDSIFNPDHFKDAAYGEALRNSGTSASDYVAFCKTLGIHLYAVETPDYAHAIQAAHQYIRENKPVIFTRDDPYVDQRVHPDWTHVCVFFGEDGSGLTALDPYIAKPVYKTDAAWVDILRNSELWLAERIEDVVTIDIHNPEIAAHFDELNPHQWRSKATGKIIQYAMLSNYKTEGNHGNCGWDILGDVVSNEVPLPGYSPGSVMQFYRNGVRGWDKATGKVFPLALYDGPGQDPAISTLQKQVASLQAQLTIQQQTPDPIAAIHAVQAAVAPFK